MEILNIGLSTTSLPNRKAINAENLRDSVTPGKAAYTAGGIKGFWALYLTECLESRSKEANRFLGLARAYVSLGEKDKALDNLERAEQERAFLSVFIGSDPMYESLRSEPRFQKLLNRMGLASS